MQDKKWFKLFIFLGLFCLLSIMLINYTVDPYGVFRTGGIEHVNKTKISSKEYLIKARGIVREKPNVIFLGTSRTRIGLDPVEYERLMNEEAYNIGLSGANLYEQKQYFLYALKANPDVKRVIIGLDFGAFNEYSMNKPTFNDHRLDHFTFIKEDLLMILLTKQSLKDSVKVLIDNAAKRRNYTAARAILSNGSHNEQLLLNVRQQLKGNDQDYFYRSLETQLKDEHYYGKFKLSEDRLNDLREIVLICKERNIELIPFFSPVHAIQLEGKSQAGLWNEFEEWKREVVHIVPGLWDFTGFNSVTTRSPENFDNYIDSSHYRKNIGRYVFHRILEKETEQVPSDFGVRLYKDNLEEHLEAIRNERNTWEKENSDIVQKINDLDFPRNER